MQLLFPVIEICIDFACRRGRLHNLIGSSFGNPLLTILAIIVLFLLLSALFYVVVDLLYQIRQAKDFTYATLILWGIIISGLAALVHYNVLSSSNCSILSTENEIGLLPIYCQAQWWFKNVAAFFPILPISSASLFLVLLTLIILIGWISRQIYTLYIQKAGEKNQKLAFWLVIAALIISIVFFFTSYLIFTDYTLGAPGSLIPDLIPAPIIREAPTPVDLPF